MLNLINKFIYLFLGFQAQETTSQTALRDCSKEEKGKAGYIGVFAAKPGSRNIKRLFLIKENQISLVKEVNTSLCIGRCKSLGSLKSFPWYAPQLSGGSVLCFPILGFLRCAPGWWWWGWLLDGLGNGPPVCLHPELPQGSPPRWL